MKNKNLLTLLISILVLSKIPTSSAAEVQIGQGGSSGTASPAVNDNDTILFTGSSSGTLTHNTASRTLGTVTTNSNGVGTINFDTANQTLTLGSVGSADKKINGINFNASGSALEIRGSLYTINGITAEDASGNPVLGTLTVNGSKIDIVGNIASNSSRLNTINVLSNSSATFHDNVFTNSFVMNSSDTTTTLNGSNSALGAVNLSGTNTRLNLNGNATATTLTTSTSSTLQINSAKQLNFSGAATINGTLSIGVDSSSNLSATTSVISNNTFTVNNGATINFDYSNSSYLQVGNIYNFVATSGTLNINGTQTITDNSFLLAPTFTSVSGATNYLEVRQNLDTANRALLNAEDQALTNFLISSPVSAIDNPRTALLRLSTQTEVEDALSTFDTDKSNMLQRTAMSISNAVGNIISSHLQSANFDSFYKQNSTENGSNLWGEIFGATATQSSTQQKNSTTNTTTKVKGYTSNFSGVVFGLDKTLKDSQVNSTWGGSLFYSMAQAENEALSKQKTDINSYGLSFYNYNVFKDGLGFFNENSAGAAYNQYDSERNIKIGSFKSRSTAKFSGAQYEAKISFGYNFKVADNAIFAPIASMKYFGMQMQDYKEENQDGIGMKVSNSNFNLFTSELGFKFTTDMILINASWLHNLSNKGAKTSSAFLNDSSSQKFQSAGVDLDADILNFGTQLNLRTSQNSKIMLRYDLQKSSYFISHLGSVKFSLEF
jgi:hypothetical protein